MTSILTSSGICCLDLDGRQIGQQLHEVKRAQSGHPAELRMLVQPELIVLNPVRWDRVLLLGYGYGYPESATF